MGTSLTRGPACATEAHRHRQGHCPGNRRLALLGGPRKRLLTGHKDPLRSQPVVLRALTVVGPAPANIERLDALPPAPARNFRITDRPSVFEEKEMLMRYFAGREAF